jgi:tetratricopeptide (TPR) repeat protein
MARLHYFNLIRTRMSAWDQLVNEKYSDAVAAFSEEIQNAQSEGAYNNRGMAYLHLGDYDEALADFREADSLSQAALNTVSDGAMIGVALWMAGREQEAMATWLTGVGASLAGTVRYGDAAGGVTIGNLLFFAGLRLANKDAVTSATRLLRKRLRTKQSIAWPGPVSRYLLGIVSESDMLAGVSNVPILRERHLCQAHFYIGVHAFSDGDQVSYFEAMHKAYNFGRVAKLGAEYYLALHEDRDHNSTWLSS